MPVPLASPTDIFRMLTANIPDGSDTILKLAQVLNAQYEHDLDRKIKYGTPATPEVATTAKPLFAGARGFQVQERPVAGTAQGPQNIAPGPLQNPNDPSPLLEALPTPTQTTYVKPGTPAVLGLEQQKLNLDRLGKINDAGLEVDPNTAAGASLLQTNGIPPTAVKSKPGKPQETRVYYNPDTREFRDTPFEGAYPESLQKALEYRTAFSKEKTLQDQKLAGEMRAEERRLAAEDRKKIQTENKPLSGEAAKVESIAKTMIPEIEKLKAEFRTDYKGSLKGILLGTNRKLVKLFDNVSDKVGRLRSGGAINRDEEAKFKRQIASLGDMVFGSSQEALDALDGIITEATSVRDSIRPGSGGTTQSTANTGTSGVTPGGRKYQVIE